MVDSGVGRTELTQFRWLEAQLRRRPKSNHGEMRQPLPTLPLVDTGALEPLVEPRREPRRAIAGVVEGDHSDASRLAVTPGGECRKLCSGAGLRERSRDDWGVGGRPGSEEGKRDVKLLAPRGPKPFAIWKGLVLPRKEPLDDVVGQLQGAEQP